MAVNLETIFIVVFCIIAALVVVRIAYNWHRGYRVYLVNGRIVTITNDGEATITTPIVAAAVAYPVQSNQA